MAATERWPDRILQDGEWLCASFGNLMLVVMSILDEWRATPLYGAQCACLNDTKLPTPTLPCSTNRKLSSSSTASANHRSTS
jgi:hypothetical protein